MKQILSVLLLTVMLRVWFNGGGNYAGLRYAEGTGIVIGANVDSPTPFLVVRLDDGSITALHVQAVYKTKWVEVKAEK